MPDRATVDASELRQLLTGARNAILKHGWVQHKAGSLGEGFCLVGAIVAVSSKRSTVYGNGADVYRFLSKFTDGSPVHWNDAPGRTREEVLELLETAIEAVS